MNPTNDYLWRLSGEALALCYRGAAGFAAHLSGGSSLILSGENATDFNYAIIDEDINAENHLIECVQAVKLRKLPLTVLLTPKVAAQLKPVAEKLGLQFAEHFPWMTYQPTSYLPESSAFEIKRAVAVEDLLAANIVISSAINVDVKSVNRAFGPMFLSGPGLDLFVAKQEGKVVSTVQTTRAGSTVGIWAMATSPDHQRKGVGKALLNNVIGYHCRQGADFFYLGATPAGKPLYDRIGFKTVAVADIWVLQ